MERDVRKSVITLLLATTVVAGLVGPAHGKKAKPKKRPVTFEAKGSIALPNPADLFDVGVTRTEFESSCSVPSATQGADGYVIDLPREVTAVTTRVYVTGTSPSEIGLLDMFFFDEACTEVGRILGSDDGDPLMPPGVKFVLVTNWLGDPTSFTFTATQAR